MDEQLLQAAAAGDRDAFHEFRRRHAADVTAWAIRRCVTSDGPPAGTVIVSVLGPRGQMTDLDLRTDTLMVEIAAPAVAERLGHGG